VKYEEKPYFTGCNMKSRLYRIKAIFNMEDAGSQNHWIIDCDSDTQPVLQLLSVMWPL